MLTELGLSPANLLFVGGGNFYLLIPQSQKEKLEELRKEMDNGELVRQHQSLSFSTPEQLHVYVGHSPVELSKFENFGEKWQEVDVAVNEHRTELYKFAKFSDVFAPLPAINQSNRREAEQAFYKNITEKLNSDPQFSIVSTNNGDWTGIESQHVSGESNKSFPLPYSYGHKIFRLQKKNQVSKSLLTHLICNHDCQLDEFKPDKKGIPNPFYFFVNKLPIWNENNMASWGQLAQKLEKAQEKLPKNEQEIPQYKNTISFYLLAKKAKERTGTDKLGVLKMDVDDLGQLFQKRLGEDQKSISHTSAISRALKWFFEGYMNTLLARKLSVTLVDGKQNERYTKILEQYPEECFEDNLYIIFSGGDDFFFSRGLGYSHGICPCHS